MPVDNLSANMQTIGQYDLVEKIAEGGMGTVYRGRNRTTGETVAVKVVPHHLLSNPVVLKRFEQEYLVARAIDHPNIVKALDFGRQGDDRFLVMEYVQGESLGQKIERDGKLPEADAVRIISQVALGLQKAHKQGLIHRDVKPDNVLLTPDGQVKLTDLGLVKEVEADLNLTRTGRGLGTPHFMSPEQFRNAKKADVRCDIYSLGLTLYMMVTGELPFKSNGPLDAWMKKINNEIEAPRKLVPALSERVDWAIRRAISPDPVHRPGSCKEFIEDLTGHSTKLLSSVLGLDQGSADYWYLVYTDEKDSVHTVKGTIKAIRRSVQDGLLGDVDEVRVAKTKAGPFEPLESYEDFRDLVVRPDGEPASESKASDGKATMTEIAKPKSTPKVDGKSTDSAVLTDTTILTAIADAAMADSKVKAVSKKPCINLKATDSPLATIVWQWIIMGMLFACAGVLATYLWPLVRQIRLF